MRPVMNLMIAALAVSLASSAAAATTTFFAQKEIEISDSNANCDREGAAGSPVETCSQDFSFSWPGFPASQNIERIRVFADLSYKDDISFEGEDPDYAVFGGCEPFFGDCFIDATALSSVHTSFDLRLGGSSVWDFTNRDFRSVRCKTDNTNGIGGVSLGDGECRGSSETFPSDYRALGLFSASDISKNFQLRYRDFWSASILGSSDDDLDLGRRVSGTFSLFVEYDVTVISVIDPPVTPTPSVVPLPAGGVLLLTGLAGIISLKRRNRRAA